MSFSVQISCGRKIAENLTYWESNGVESTTGDCNVEVCKIVDSIAQIRLNFNSVRNTDRSNENGTLTSAVFFGLICIVERLNIFDCLGRGGRVLSFL